MTFELDLENLETIDISVPLRFNGPQPNAWGVERAVSSPVVAGEMIGDTRHGGSVNFERYTFIPHCSGTHTECVGHITHERISIRDCLRDAILPAKLITISPITDNNTGDLLVTSESLREQIADGNDRITALIIRTVPNGEWKQTSQYGENNIPAYFTPDAIDLIVELGVRHLLVDLPSIDRIFDEGKLVNHRRFWNIEPESHEINPATRIRNTITELIYVPDTVIDGEYLLNLQIAPFESDCSPSRPILINTIN